MDFGLMTVDGAVATAHQSAYYGSLLANNKPDSGDSNAGVRNVGSGQLKQERSGPAEDTSRVCKAPSFLLRSGGGSVPGKPTMLSFSNLSAAVCGDEEEEEEDSSKTRFCFPFFQSDQKRAAGPHSGGASGYGVRGWSESSRGTPFTPSQWMELEHQALIYKHLVSNVPIPSNLLTPLTKAINPYYISGCYASNWGWGASHVGFASNTDPEPGRCRRTDGKKWRCSRDAVPDQKYCERHINRGRHRSRKPVEGQTGRAVSGSATNTAKVSPVDGGASDSLKHHFINNTLPIPANSSTDHLMKNRTQGFSVIYPSVNLKSSQESCIQKQHNPGFGFLSSDSGTFLDFNGQEGWTKERFTRASDELKPDWTRLSMSIPMASSDFSPPSISPQQEKPTADLSWGNSSMGGPLGEVLNSTYGKSSSSPTGVLQNPAFVSLSNSSSGGSPPPR